MTQVRGKSRALAVALVAGTLIALAPCSALAQSRSAVARRGTRPDTSNTRSTPERVANLRPEWSVSRRRVALIGVAFTLVGGLTLALAQANRDVHGVTQVGPTLRASTLGASSALFGLALSFGAYRSAARHALFASDAPEVQQRLRRKRRRLVRAGRGLYGVGAATAALSFAGIIGHAGWLVAFISPSFLAFFSMMGTACLAAGHSIPGGVVGVAPELGRGRIGGRVSVAF